MEKYVWQCCRFCLSVQSLNPIFTMPEHKEKYTSTIYEATGVMVEINDTHPKEICTSCVAFINKSIQFRRKCAEIQKNFENKVNVIEVDKINILDSTAIDISHLTDDPFGDYDDNITLDTFQFSDPHVTDVQTETDANIEDKKFNIVDSVTDISIDINIVAKEEPYNEKNDEFSNVMITDIKGKVDNKLMDSDGNKRRAKRRMNDTKSIETKKGNTKEEIECEYCHKILTSKLSVRNHYKIHTGFDIVCEHCGKKFITRRLLLMHCRAKHGYEKTDKCSYCDYKASNAEQVKIHERLHTGEKPFVCKECNTGFHRKSSYLQHVAIHLPEKTVQCEQCPARFKSVTLMRIHASRHRAPRYAFSCGLCGGAFARRRNVARHLARVHASRQSPDHHIQRHKIH